MKIQRASAEDKLEIARLLKVQLEEHHVEIAEKDLLAGIEGVFERPERGFFLVAIEQGRCVGVAYVSFIWALEHGGHSAWLEELYLEPASRGHGHGQELLEAVISECQSQGCSAIDLEIDADHERVRSLYARNGFIGLPRSRNVRYLR